ncbi:PfkB family carbohydrate kinase [Rahnella victoriana]|uniref:PfkB family carbohydrate kinase n=1 Tax=Rahnella victoriana TaxID=1510570 RepID=UPI0039F134D5
MINIIGGLYREKCLKPSWDDIFGSGGRAAIAIAQMGNDVHLHAYAPQSFVDEFQYKIDLIDQASFILTSYKTDEKITFDYDHGLDPMMPPLTNKKNKIELEAENVLIFGMLECSFKTKSVYAVYDPQNTLSTESFSETGSIAKHLALVLNEHEAKVLNGSHEDENIYDIISSLHIKEKAEVIVVKRGPTGAIVSYGNNTYNISAYKTDNVWKIGSGDCFSAHFANNWINNKDKPEVAAQKASIATSYFCNTSILPLPFVLRDYSPIPVMGESDNLKNTTIYLAGPFFTLSQIWLIEQARYNLQEMGLQVISPYHDIGVIDPNNTSRKEQAEISAQDLNAIVRSDIIFGIADGNDPGTVFEIGYAVSLGKKVILLAENCPKNDLTMFCNENVEITHDYVTAIYKTLWSAL